MTLPSPPPATSPTPVRRTDQLLLWQFFRYVLVGALTTGTDWGTFYLAHVRGGLSPFLATVLCFATATVVSYTLNCLFTFRARQFAGARQVIRYLAVLLLMLALHEGLMYLFLRVFHCPSMPGRIAVSALMMPVNFLLLRRWVFTPHR